MELTEFMQGGAFVAPEELRQRTMRRIQEEALSRSTGQTASCSANITPGKLFSGTLRRGVLTFAAAAASLALVFSVYLFGVEDTRISIDVNPSLELSLNRFQRVISAVPYNNDAKELLSGMSLYGKSYDDAVDELLLEQEKRGYLGGESVLSFSVYSRSPGSEDSILENLEQLSGEAYQDNSQMYFTALTKEDMYNAHTEGLSMGKYSAIKALMSVDPTASMSECREHSMGEIYRLTNEACHGDASVCNGHSSLEGSGNGNAHKHGQHENCTDGCRSMQR